MSDTRPPVLFLDAKQALEYVALAGESSGATAYLLAQEPLSGAPPQLVHVPPDRLVAFFIDSGRALPTEVVFPPDYGTDLCESLRNDLATLFAQVEQRRSPPLEGEKLERELCAFIGNRFGDGAPVGRDESLFYSGLVDSLGISLICAEISARSGREILGPELVENDLDTVHLLVSHVLAKR